MTTGEKIAYLSFGAFGMTNLTPFNIFEFKAVLGRHFIGHITIMSFTLGTTRTRNESDSGEILGADYQSFFVAQKGFSKPKSFGESAKIFYTTKKAAIITDFDEAPDVADDILDLTDEVKD